MKRLLIILFILASTVASSQTWVKHGENLYLKVGSDSVAVTALAPYLTAQWGQLFGQLSQQADLVAALDAKQNALQSGVNIKTINNQSLVGSGNIQLEGVGVSMLDVYPVGSIYISVSNTNPSSLFGGTWVAFAVGRTIIGVDAGQTEFDTVEETGGAKSKTLNTTEIPAHSHNIPDVRSATTGGANTRVARTADASSTAGNDVSTGDAGGGQAFSILNPYVTVYMWRRTL